MQRVCGILPVMLLVSLCGRHSAQCQVQPAVPSDDVAIKQTALDYIEGWYEGDPARMERALHPELAKRMVVSDMRGHSQLHQISAMTLVQSTRARSDKQTP